MRDEMLYAAYEATYLAEFRWIKAALAIPYTPGPDRGSGITPHVLIRPARRAAIYARDQRCCYLCGLPVAADLHEGPWACTLDHIRPLRHDGARTAMSNLALAHKQCNQSKGSSPHPHTIYESNGWCCQRCLEGVSRGADQDDWQWDRPIVEHVVPLDSPEIWWYGRCWTCHLRCHAYHLPIPPLVLAHSNVVPHAGSHRQEALITPDNARGSVPQ